MGRTDRYSIRVLQHGRSTLWNFRGSGPGQHVVKFMPSNYLLLSKHCPERYLAAHCSIVAPILVQPIGELSLDGRAGMGSRRGFPAVAILLLLGPALSLAARTPDRAQTVLRGEPQAPVWPDSYSVEYTFSLPYTAKIQPHGIRQGTGYGRCDWRAFPACCMAWCLMSGSAGDCLAMYKIPRPAGHGTHRFPEPLLPGTPSSSIATARPSGSAWRRTTAPTSSSPPR